MISRYVRSPRRARRHLLLLGASMATLASGLGSVRAEAQTLGAMLGRQQSIPRPQIQQPDATPVRSPTMQAALARQRSTQSSIAQIRAYAASVRLAATRSGASDGLASDGLDPTDTIRAAIAAARAGDTTRANLLLVSAGAASDATGLNTWEGVGLPSQTIVDGRVVVTIDQTQSRALLSWNSFNIGANTTLQFNQKQDGTAQPGWVAVNRVTNAINPSLILGNLNADGTVVVLNRAGIIFGKDSQVNTHSLLASTLELGNAAVAGKSGRGNDAATIKDRNDYYLANGLFAPANGTASNTATSTGAALLVSAPLQKNGTTLSFADETQGDIIIDTGARLNAGTGGFVILAAPSIDTAGTITAEEGQVSLQAGRAVTFVQSTGAATDIDPYVRGYKLNSYDYTLNDSNQRPRDAVRGDGKIVVRGLIQSDRGYLSLGAGALGSIEQDGLLATTTSVSRNGKISITAGNITLGGNANGALASGIEMVADTNGETIPQGSANAPATFKASQLEIGTQVQLQASPIGALLPTNFTMGQNALIYAPGANVSIGATTVPSAQAGSFYAIAPGHIDIASGATIDVSGLKDVELAASRNSIAITPVKRNELRDTPNYREVAVDGNFTLNGATLYVDPRVSGVRADGVAWVGSPLIEAGSLAGQIGVTAQEFMTKGGTVSLQTATPPQFSTVTLANAPSVHIARDATIDFSGGWVRYAAGTVQTSRLITSDGRIVDIAQADPNDTYVGVVDGVTEVQPRFGILRTYLNAAAQGLRYDAAYDEGRDAGALTITTSAATVDGTFYANAFAGSQQIAEGIRPSLASTLAGDGRLLQNTPYQLPSGGGLSIATLGDMTVYHGTRGAADSNGAELVLNDAMLSGAGLSALSLQAPGSITFAGANPSTLQTPDALTITGASDLALAPGGALTVAAGRMIRFDGTVTAASGAIDARTDLNGFALGNVGPTNGSVFRTGLYGDGNGDDLATLYAVDPGMLRPFDIVVTGTLSTAGLWTNDFGQSGVLRGSAFRDGGSITLTSAANAFAAIGTSMSTATQAVDLSGSLRVAGMLDVMSGGYVSSTGTLLLDGKGGNVSLINATTYASTRLTNNNAFQEGGSTSNIPLGGTSQSVDFTPIPSTSPLTNTILPNLVPDPRATVEIADGAISGFGFAGGGTFTLVAPDVSFGSDMRAGSTHIGLDFFRTTGFGTLDVSSYRARIVDDVFTNARAGKSAFLDTTSFVVGAGETLDLTQWMMPSILTSDQAQQLRLLGSDADLSKQALLSPIKPAALWDQKAANLVLGGLTELDVLAGGTITGAPAASLTISKLYNGGTISLHGGSITQSNDLPDSVVAGGLGVDSLADAFAGATDSAGRFDENAKNAAGITVSQAVNSPLLTNRELVSRDGADRLIYFLGRLDASQGVLLDNGSVTDLSGIAVLDPRAVRTGDGTQIRTGRVLDGGALVLQSGVLASRLTGAAASFSRSRASTITRRDGARLDISGTSAVLDQATGLGTFTPYLAWSAAGTLSALGGGSLGTTAIFARGGAQSAEGGTLEWLRPTVGSSTAGAVDYLSAAMIAASGFDSLIARNTLTLDGTFSLSLRKALMVTSQDPTIANSPFVDANVRIGATAGTNATIGAGYVRFASRLGTAGLPAIPGAADGTAAVRFIAGSQGFDFVGGIGLDRSVASVAFATPGDVRFTGVNDNQGTQISYDGQLVAAAADMLIDARRSYATTGTGNLQGLLQGLSSDLTAPFDVAVAGKHSITFGNSYLDAAASAPLSAGTHLRVLASNIIQNGYLAAPLGLLELGSNAAVTIAGGGGLVAAPTSTITFGAGSVTTVSGAGLNIPYGSTTDLIEYYFPTVTTPITKLPTGQLTLSAGSIVEQTGALIDGRGGGDVFAYEFQSGVGGSRDVLDRINRDPFSSNDFNLGSGTGYQYADHRQVFALVPVSQAGAIAAYDPLYSADYGSAGPVDLYGASAGLKVTLDGAPGVPAGEYLLVPAKYAVAIPGALRLVENTGSSAPLPGQSTTLLDGSILVGGTYGYADTGIAESTRRGFTIQTSDTFRKYSQIVTTGGTAAIIKDATDAGLAPPRVPLDAARVILSPLTELRIAGAFDTHAATGGRGGEFDLLGSNIVIAADDSVQTPAALTLSAATVAGLNATSLLIGGQRSDSADGTTAIAASAGSIRIRSGVTLDTPELLLAVGGAGSRLSIEDGVTLKATGAIGTQPTTDYTAATAGSILRLGSGGERFVARSATGDSTVRIGAATIGGGSLTLDTSGTFAVSDTANLAVDRVAISSGTVQFDGRAAVAGQSGVIGSALEAKLAAAQQLTVRSAGAILFSAGEHHFNDLVLDTGTIGASAGNSATDSVTIDAGNVRLLNSLSTGDGCATVGLCGHGSDLTLNSATLSFGANAVRTAGFADAVTVSASAGMYVEGAGSFSTGSTALALRAPFLADRSVLADPRDQKVRPDYSFLTDSYFTLTAPAGGAGVAPSGNAAPGARITIGAKDAPVASAAIVGSLIRASAGIIDIQSRGDVALAGATLSTPGYQQVFGDSVDAVTVSAGGGTINLQSGSGNIGADAASTVIVDSGIGSAGTLNLLAGNGLIGLAAAINPGVAGNRNASFAFDAGLSRFDLDDFAARYGRLFGGDVAVRSGVGDITLAAGQSLKARSVSLTADGGGITIGGTIDTAGVDVTGMTAEQARDAAVDGGDIALWGRGGVTLAATARLDAHTMGYADTDSRVASAGDVTIGIENQDAAITIAKGAIIDVGARRTQAAQAVGETGGRLVPEQITDSVTGNPVTVYRYAAPDSGGTLSLRAPVLGAGEDKVAVSLLGSVLGAGSLQLEAFKRYDLDGLADSGLYSGISRGTDGTVLLDFAAGSANGGKFNPFTESFQLADGGSSVVKFIQGFGVTSVDGSSLDGMRLRPGVELAADGSIQTTTAWNLAAATFSPAQLQAAVDAGVLQAIPALSTGGQTQYAVVPGQEGALLDHFATFLYRVDGSARGEAPVVTLRAGGDLTVNRSISDGFFTFHDKSDPAYISNQLGGGDRTYQPAIQFSCGSTGFCSNIVNYQTGAAKSPGTNGTLVISLGSQALQGDAISGTPQLVNSPLSLTGNGADGGGEGQDSLGFGELFPLLDGDVAMHSSSVRLVAGADATLSANPLHVDAAHTADMIVAGEYSYSVKATGTVTYGGSLQLGLVNGTTPTGINVDIDGGLSAPNQPAALNGLKPDAYTQLNWGTTTGLGADARAAAIAYFAGKGYRFVGSASSPTGIIAPLNEVVGFLQSFESTYQAGLASNRAGYTANRTIPVKGYGAADQAYVRSYVRTGDGSIDAVASRDVDVRGAANLLDRDAITYRKEDGTSTATGTNQLLSVQFSAAALYTAGVRIAQATVSARIAGGPLVSIVPDSPYFASTPENAMFIPSPKALSDTAPVEAFDGGDISISAGRDILGSRDVWSEKFLDTGRTLTTGGGASTVGIVGRANQRWRVGTVDIDTEIGILPRDFTSGVGALAGGDVVIRAGRDVSNLTVALTNSVTTAPTTAGAAMLSFGNGNLTIAAGSDILAGRIDIASGAATIHAGGDIAAFGIDQTAGGVTPTPQFMRLRLADAVANVSANGAVTLASVSALGVDNDTAQSADAAGFFSPAAAINIAANEAVTIATPPPSAFFQYGLQPSFGNATSQPNRASDYIQVLPPSVQLISLTGSVSLPSTVKQLLYPSTMGQLRLFSDGDLSSLAIAMSDADPGLIGGAFARSLLANPYQFPFVATNTTDAALRNQHNRLLTHLGDADPVRIYTNGDIDSAAIFLPKQGRITAGGDITDLFFSGQNLDASDITRIRAGGDITGTVASNGLLPYVVSNNFILGGPGTLIVEAGGDIGPFVTSAEITSVTDGNTYSFGGGIRTVGNDYNPWLSNAGADLQVRFGMVGGADYAALRDTYLNPQNFAKLDGDLFEQVSDAFGNQRPDRSKPIYAPLLAQWLRDKDPQAFATIFGGQSYPDTAAGNAALASAAYGRTTELYDAFLKVDALHQQDFLVNDLYFHEIAEVGDKSGPSFQQYIRGYRAIQTLFPTRLGYTDNLAPYTLDPATITADHPLGEPVRTIVDGQPEQAVRVETGNVDLRLATIQTARGGNITILGPGGDIIAGSVVRTADQAARRGTAFRPARAGENSPPELVSGTLAGVGSAFQAVPQGYEGLLTLRGGDIRAFIDGSFILNQSRAFTQQGGDIVMWSSNGDLNAGQGPKSASTFPPVTLRFDEDGLSEVNSAGSVAGAGIGTFRPSPDDPAGDVILIAPVGTVDAGDAGVRASGNVIVAAARVANADNFKAAGSITGVPSQAVTNAAVVPTGANEVQAQLKDATRAAQPVADRRSLITVDVLGPTTDGRCENPSRTDDPDCRSDRP